MFEVKVGDVEREPLKTVWGTRGRALAPDAIAARVLGVAADWGCSAHGVIGGSHEICAIITREKVSWDLRGEYKALRNNYLCAYCGSDLLQGRLCLGCMVKGKRERVSMSYSFDDLRKMADVRSSADTRGRAGDDRFQVVQQRKPVRWSAAAFNQEYQWDPVTLPDPSPDPAETERRVKRLQEEILAKEAEAAYQEKFRRMYEYLQQAQQGRIFFSSQQPYAEDEMERINRQFAVPDVDPTVPPKPKGRRGAKPRPQFDFEKPRARKIELD